MKRGFGWLIKAVMWLTTGVTALVVLLLVTWFVMPDEDIDSEVAQILSTRVMVPPEQNVFYAMWGLRSDPSLDPHDVGRKVLATLKLAHEQKRAISDADLKSSWGVSPLEIKSTEKRYCTFDSPACLLAFRTARAKVEVNERELAPYLVRYRTLRAYPAFEEIPPLGLDLPMLGYAELIALSDLTDARIALDATNESGREGALRNLSAELRLWRQIALRADTLITKMIAVTVLHRKFRVASELLSESPKIAILYPGLISEISRPLTPEETSVNRVLTGEFRLKASVFLDLAEKQELGDVFSGSVGYLEKLFLVGGFKPNASINSLYGLTRVRRDFYAQPISAVVEGTPVFLAEQNDYPLLAASTLFYNPVGKILVNISNADWENYVYALHNLAAYSRLIELQRRIAVSDLRPDEIPGFLTSVDVSLRDPYTGKPMRWDAQSMYMSFEGHGKASNALRVRLGLN